MAWKPSGNGLRLPFDGREHPLLRDNLEILRRYVADESVDLIYLDPPFNSDADYNVLLAEKDGTQAQPQITAFKETWTWGLEAAREYAEVLHSGHDRVALSLKGIHRFLDGNEILAYVSMTALRLIELLRVLKPTGPIYLHCDPTGDLRGVIERGEAAIGVFICVEEPTAPMRKEAADAGFFQTKSVGASRHLRLQILAIDDLLQGKKIDMPAQQEIRRLSRLPRRNRKRWKTNNCSEPTYTSACLSIPANIRRRTATNF